MSRSWAAAPLITLFRQEIERLFQEALEVAGEPLGTTGWQPPLDIIETPDRVLVLVEVPGLAADDLSVEVKGRALLIRGAKVAPSMAGRFHRVERPHGSFERRIKILWPVNGHKGRAQLRDGVLTIELPRVEEKRQTPKRIEIVAPAPEGGERATEEGEP